MLRIVLAVRRAGAFDCTRRTRISQVMLAWSHQLVKTVSHPPYFVLRKNDGVRLAMSRGPLCRTEDQSCIGERLNGDPTNCHRRIRLW